MVLKVVVLIENTYPKKGVAKVKDEKKKICNATSMEQGGKITDV